MATLKQEIINRLVSPEIRMLVDKIENDETWRQALVGDVGDDYTKAVRQRLIANAYDIVSNTKVLNKVDKWYFNRAVKRAKAAETKAVILRAVLGAEEQPAEPAKPTRGQVMTSIVKSLEQSFGAEYRNHK